MEWNSVSPESILLCRGCGNDGPIHELDSLRSAGTGNTGFEYCPAAIRRNFVGQTYCALTAVRKEGGHP